MERSSWAAPGLATAALILCFAAPAWGQGRSTSALDLVYEAADAIDAARAELEAGRQREADRLLNRAERFLDEAARLAPDLRRVQFERARLLQADGDPSRAEALLLTVMHGPMAPRDHVRAVSTLDDIRDGLGKPTAGAQWRTTTAVRNAGIATIGAGIITAIAGFAGGFDALAQDTYHRVDSVDTSPRQAGLAVGIAGAGIAGFGGALTIGGIVERGKLRFVLPGPWRLPGGDLEEGSKPPPVKETERPQGDLR